MFKTMQELITNYKMADKRAKIEERLGKRRPTPEQKIKIIKKYNEIIKEYFKAV
ncbi:hypothetical protein [Campylobacter gastrosuis]|uniref:Uncharacterized protein n=1 Tax=Campylobacter gastrosuis TaxID=2974576 RepID=A0ABT7HTZ8_9BACT|nr:hypothetical protein [Campylobacter gastrosuis]MDL0089918.1 hypothetical protein [Campylobacter gastrosuis]